VPRLPREAGLASLGQHDATVPCALRRGGEVVHVRAGHDLLALLRDDRALRVRDERVDHGGREPTARLLDFPINLSTQ